MIMALFAVMPVLDTGIHGAAPAIPRLLDATPDQRRHWRVAGGGWGIHWPDIDEDLSTEGLLRGARAPRATA
ncbi:MAG: DUF2442 domain-containing protein [Alphaproteobacteria bacterium]|nr:DUF2442 domain-containing protein [Alphaproteobacteria bacterium]